MIGLERIAAAALAATLAVLLAADVAMRAAGL